MTEASAEQTRADSTTYSPAAISDAGLPALLERMVHDPHLSSGISRECSDALVARFERLAQRAFQEEDGRDSKLNAQRCLYVLLLAHFSTPWDRPANNSSHPVISAIRYALESRWEAAEARRHAAVLASVPAVEGFEQWSYDVVRSHHSNVTHPLFKFLRDEASLVQVREFFFQESPLELFFGDIVGSLLPGVYGEPKLEIAANYWDEVGRAQDERVHRNMRRQMMRIFGIPVDAHVTRFESLLLEELELINTYLSLATSRGKLGQLVGALLATENMIPGRFEYQIEGMRRLGITDADMGYMLEHTTVDVEHANGWMQHVVKPLLADCPALRSDLAFGILRRLQAAGAVCDVMVGHLARFRQGTGLSFEGLS